MKKVKIAHIITMLELGGAQQNTLYTIEHLDRTFFEPVLICGAGGILDEEAKRLPVKVYFVPHLIREIKPVYDFIAFLEILRILFIEKPDMVHTHSSKAGVLGRLAAWLTNKICDVQPQIKIIHTFHGFGFNDYQKPSVKKTFVFSEKIAGKITDKFIFVSRDNTTTASGYEIGEENKYILIRSGIKISRYRNVPVSERLRDELGIKDNERIITTIGPFKPQKNIIDFIKIARILAEQSSTIPELKSLKFLVIGDGEQHKILESEIKNSKLTEKVILLGWRKDIPEILARTDIFVMTSLWEGLPRAVVEAMVSGKPVVAYAVDGVREIVKDSLTGYLITPKDVKTAVEKISFLLQKPEWIKQLGKAGEKIIDETFDIDYMVRQQEKLYLELSGKLVVEEWGRF